LKVQNARVTFMDVGVQNHHPHTGPVATTCSSTACWIKWLRGASTALGTLGLAAFLLLQADRPLYHSDGGVPERIAVYTILAFELMLGVILLIRPPRQSSSPPIHIHNVAERLAS